MLERCNCSVWMSISREGEVQNFASLYPWLDLHVLSGNSRRHPGAICQVVGFRQLAHWKGVTGILQLGRWKTQFLMLGPFILGWIHAQPAVAHSGTQELFARVGTLSSFLTLKLYDCSVCGQTT